jgi:hypothetical protein
MVKCAEICYTQYPTIVNDLKESGITYQNTMTEYARMDNKLARSQMGIGYSSNLAQLALTYYWTEKQKDNPDKNRLKELYDNFVILSVIAQVLIDGCKREYEVDGMKELDRISKMDCMSIKKRIKDKTGKEKYIKYDFPEFMKYTREIQVSKNNKALPLEEIQKNRDKLKQRINPTLSCPMNWLEECLDKIQGASTVKTEPITNYFIKMKGRANSRQMTKISKLIEDYDGFVKHLHINCDNKEIVQNELIRGSEYLLSELKNIKIGNPITINRLIETSLGLDTGVGNSKQLSSTNSKYCRKILNYLYKMDKKKFLINFKEKLHH